MRRAVVSLVVVSAFVACSSFDETGGTPAAPAVDAGAPAADGATTVGPDAAAPSGPLVRTPDAIAGLCASARGVAWTHGTRIGGFADGVLQPDIDVGVALAGPCVLSGLDVVFTHPAGVRRVRLGSACSSRWRIRTTRGRSAS